MIRPPIEAHSKRTSSLRAYISIYMIWKEVGTFPSTASELDQGTKIITTTLHDTTTTTPIT